jgi:hypothetical protein
MEIWYVQGDEEHMFFAFKIDAERYARLIFPDEPVDRRYARIFCVTVYTFDAEGNLKEYRQ